MFAYSSAESDYYESDGEELDWQEAACRDGPRSLTGLFFSDEAVAIEVAKAICAGCSLRRPCLEGALARREPAGVWGGQLFVEGQVVPFKRKRGRPRKTAGGVAAAALAPREEERKSA